MLGKFAMKVVGHHGHDIFTGTCPLGTPVPRVGEYITAPGVPSLLVTKVEYGYSNDGTYIRIIVDRK
jgi:hypothetical protein